MAEEKNKEKTTWEKLQSIQAELKAPKRQKNTYGGYTYRSCEDILEAVKPLLDKVGATLLLKDKIVTIGDRYYVKATAFFYSEDKTIEVFAYAREPEVRKGMDDAQVTGASSSYARKYALNGLFAIDDAKEIDSGKNGNEKPIDKTLEIIDQAFFNFITEYKNDLADGFVYDKDKFIKAIVKHFKKLPVLEKSIPIIVKTIKPAECIIELKPETSTERKENGTDSGF